MSVVKANAYGHGAAEVSQVSLANGAEWLAVATLDEALELREEGFPCPILILGHISEKRAAEVVQADVRAAVFNPELPLALSQAATRLGKTARVHMKIDSGMVRIGFIPRTRNLGSGQADFRAAGDRTGRDFYPPGGCRQPGQVVLP